MTTVGEVSYLRYGEVNITLRGGNNRPDKEIRAIIDTGFDGALSLPATVVAELELHRAGSMFSTVFGGEVVEFATHDVIVTIAGEERGVQALVAENPPLVGMTLLHGLHLFMDIVDGGTVALTRRPSESIKDLES